MTLIKELLLWSAVSLTMVGCNPFPGGSYHVHHRIHVPQHIKTIHHTKIIKVPEHHHHFHEKEKIIIEKEIPKIEHVPVLLKDEQHDWSGLESSTFLKKKRDAQPSAPLPSDKSKSKKRKIVQHHPYPFHKP